MPSYILWTAPDQGNGSNLNRALCVLRTLDIISYALNFTNHAKDLTTYRHLHTIRCRLYCTRHDLYLNLQHTGNYKQSEADYTVYDTICTLNIHNIQQDPYLNIPERLQGRQEADVGTTPNALQDNFVRRSRIAQRLQARAPKGGDIRNGTKGWRYKQGHQRVAMEARAPKGGDISKDTNGWRYGGAFGLNRQA